MPDRPLCDPQIAACESTGVLRSYIATMPKAIGERRRRSSKKAARDHTGGLGQALRSGEEAVH